jgi:AhpD family alkylhydroperoxidase
MTRQFEAHHLDTAPHGSRPLLEQEQKKRGFIAAPIARFATSPALLGLALEALHRFENSSLSPAKREVVAFTVAHDNGCGVCMALHTALAGRIPEVAPEVEALRRGEAPRSPRLHALSEFTRALMRATGNVAADAWNAFLAAGFTRENALDVVTGVGTYTLTTYANRLVEAPLDPMLTRFAWAEPSAA